MSCYVKAADSECHSNVANNQPKIGTHSSNEGKTGTHSPNESARILQQENTVIVDNPTATIIINDSCNLDFSLTGESSNSDSSQNCAERIQNLQTMKIM